MVDSEIFFETYQTIEALLLWKGCCADSNFVGSVGLEVPKSRAGDYVSHGDDV
jgi:hypothetical protein